MTAVRLTMLGADRAEGGVPNGSVQGDDGRRHPLQVEDLPTISQSLQAAPGYGRARHGSREHRDGPEVPAAEALRGTEAAGSAKGRRGTATHCWRQECFSTGRRAADLLPPPIGLPRAQTSPTRRRVPQHAPETPDLASRGALLAPIGRYRAVGGGGAIVARSCDGCRSAIRTGHPLMS